MRRALCEGALVALMGLMPLGSALAQPLADADRSLHVVILHNADYFLPASIVMDQALRETMLQESKRPIDFHAEALDALRHPRGIDDELVALMGKKYAGQRVDLVLARTSAGFAFARRHRDQLWPGAPVVYYNVVADPLNPLPRVAGTTGLLIDLDPQGTIELATRLHPDARHLFVIGGTAEYDRNWKRRIEPLLAKLPPSIAVTWLDHLPYAGIMQEVARLPPSSMVLFTSMVRDTEGHAHVSPQVAKEIVENASVPVYGFLDTYIGQGIVGGAVTDFAAQGRAAAQLALRVLGGESADTIPVQPSPPARCVVDHRALERFAISESLLPASCEVRHHPASLWRDYRWYAIGGSAAILLQAAMLSALLFQQRRRRDAEREAEHRRAELSQASRLALVGELTASIAHEINQPLGAILSNIDAAQMILEREPTPLAELRLIHADVRRGGLRAAEVIRRIRGLLRRQVERAACDINALVVDVVDLLHGEAARRGIEVASHLASELPPVECDRVQLQQALLNLIINAMDAMAQSPAAARRLVIRTAVAKPGIEVAVIDQGPGIAKDVLPRLFDSFFTTKAQGMGLGLSITRSVIEAHGGHIEAENNPDGGATFRFVLPVADAQVQTPPPALARAHAPPQIEANNG